MSPSSWSAISPHISCIFCLFLVNSHVRLLFSFIFFFSSAQSVLIHFLTAVCTPVSKSESPGGALIKELLAKTKRQDSPVLTTSVLGGVVLAGDATFDQSTTTGFPTASGLLGGSLSRTVLLAFIKTPYCLFSSSNSLVCEARKFTFLN